MKKKKKRKKKKLGEGRRTRGLPNEERRAVKRAGVEGSEAARSPRERRARGAAAAEEGGRGSGRLASDDLATAFMGFVADRLGTRERDRERDGP
jgi:hypothetical protein